MKKNELLQILDRLGLRPSRRLGQNFLLDPNLLAAMVRDLSPEAGEEILEIGPGTGILTEALLAAGCRVTAVEFDHRLCQWLREHFRDHDRFRLIEDDACAVDYDREFGERPYRCIANLPYNLSSPWLIRMTRLRNRPAEMGLLVQKELADRLTAEPRCKAYGALTLALGLFYRVERTRRVPPTVFHPVPEVESACLRLRSSQRAHALGAARRELFLRLVRLGFSQRRKQLRKLLLPHFPDIGPTFADFCRERNFPPGVRAEELNLEDFLRLAAMVG